jgi:predicted RNase H-like nuclease
MSGWVAGVDGAKGGWLALLAQPEGAAVALALAPRWTDLPLERVNMTGVDMPIGLAESGPRACDMAARRLLPRERKPSVFPPPRRALLACATWAEANARGRALDGTGLSHQAWNLAAKIGELDRALAPADQARIREVHPELVFLRLNAGQPLARKKTAEGRALRLSLLVRAGLGGVAALMDRLPRRQAGPDDLLDAAACALAARDMLEGRATRLPSDPPPMDARGLRMEIWY